MRNLAICTLIFMASAVLTACTKENVHKTQASSSLIGTSWTIVNDSTSESAGATAPASSSNYLGKAGDYFNFSAHGKLYWSIDGHRDTATYLISGDTIKFKSAYTNAQTNTVDSAYYPIYKISNLTGNTCTLFNSQIVFGAAGAGGPILTTINLKK